MFSVFLSFSIFMFLFLFLHFFKLPHYWIALEVLVILHVYIHIYIYISKTYKKTWGKAYVELDQSNLQLPSFYSFHFFDLKLVPINSALNSICTWKPEQ